MPSCFTSKHHSPHVVAMKTTHKKVSNIYRITGNQLQKLRYRFRRSRYWSALLLINQTERTMDLPRIYQALTKDWPRCPSKATMASGKVTDWYRRQNGHRSPICSSLPIHKLYFEVIQVCYSPLLYNLSHSHVILWGSEFV